MKYKLHEQTSAWTRLNLIQRCITCRDCSALNSPCPSIPICKRSVVSSSKTMESKTRTKSYSCHPCKMLSALRTLQHACFHLVFSTLDKSWVFLYFERCPGNPFFNLKNRVPGHLLKLNPQKQGSKLKALSISGLSGITKVRVLHVIDGFIGLLLFLLQFLFFISQLFG